MSNKGSVFDKNLFDAVQAGNLRLAAHWHETGGRHHELWMFMKHLDLVGQDTFLGARLMFAYEAKGYAERFEIANWKYRNRLAPVVGYRVWRSRQLAIAILGFKRRGLLCKDMGLLIAKMVFLPYENRYSEAWGHPRDWTRVIEWLNYVLPLMLIFAITYIVLLF